MTVMSDKSEDKSSAKIAERRVGERRIRERRGSNINKHYNGIDRRSGNSDRRVTIVNRLNKVVTDRRTFD